MSSVGEEFPKEQARLTELLEQYVEIGPSGVFGAAMIKSALRRAAVAMASGDVVEIVKAYQEMKEITG